MAHPSDMVSTGNSPIHIDINESGSTQDFEENNDAIPVTVLYQQTENSDNDEDIKQNMYERPSRSRGRGRGRGRRSTRVAAQKVPPGPVKTIWKSEGEYRKEQTKLAAIEWNLTKLTEESYKERDQMRRLTMEMSRLNMEMENLKNQVAFLARHAQNIQQQFDFYRQIQQQEPQPRQVDQPPFTPQSLFGQSTMNANVNVNANQQLNEKATYQLMKNLFNF